MLAVEDYCYQKGYSLFLCNTQNDAEKIQNHLDMLIKKRVDGVLVMCSEYTQDSLELFNATKIPMVVMDWGKTGENNDVIIDNGFEGGYLAGRYLIEKGHRKIGIISGILTKNTAKERFDGFVKALSEADVSIPEQWIFEGDFEPEGGFEQMNNLLRLDDLPTAVFCASDTIALGAISALSEKGLSVPKDMSIIGYDNIHSSRFYSPPLTTIHQSKSRLGVKALDLLLDRIQLDKSQYQPQVLEFHPELVIRRSVRDLNE